MTKYSVGRGSILIGNSTTLPSPHSFQASCFTKTLRTYQTLTIYPKKLELKEPSMGKVSGVSCLLKIGSTCMKGGL